MSRYAISDIHGCNKTFRFMTMEVLRLAKGDTLYLLGDYIDRGPQSREVIDHIFELRDSGICVHALKGNHEDLCLKAIEYRGEHLELWLRNGGNTTLESFGLSSIECISLLSENSFKSRYIDFFSNLEYYLETDRFYLVHAGLNFAAPDPLKDTYSMMWIRNAAADEKFLGDKKVIHGHTPIPLSRIKGSLNEQLINIDGGCVFNWHPDLGYLVALNLETMKITSVRNME